jgi:hypothetical protein
MCDICSCEIVKSLAAEAAEASAEKDVIWLALSRSFELQAVSPSANASAIAH